MSSSTFALFLFAICISTVYSCKCTVRTNEVKYCDSDFVAHINVQRVREIPANLSDVGGEILFTVKVIRTFHTTPKYNNTSIKRQMTTPTHTCGIPLEPRTEYLVAGKVIVNDDGSQLTLHRCNWNQKWNEVSSGDKTKLLDGTFERGCH